MYADQLLANSFDKQGGNNGAVNTAGKGQQNLFAANLLAICLSMNAWASSGGGGYANHAVRTLIRIHAELF